MADLPTTTITVEEAHPGAGSGGTGAEPVGTITSGPVAPPDGDADAPRWVRRAQIGAAVVFVGLAMVPLIAIAVDLWTSGYHPAGDLAVIEMRVRDVGRYTPLLGPYSRYGWSHPGPLIYVLLAIPYRLAASGSSAILSASALFNASIVAAIGLVAWRRGRLPLVIITAALLMELIYRMTPMLLADPWNPYLTVLPVGLFVLLAWSVIERDRWCLPAAVLAGSFLAQSHVGYLPVVGAIGAAVFVVAVSRRWRTRRIPALPSADRPPWIPRPWRRPALLAVAIVALAWLPVLIDQFFGTGNLRDILEYFTGSNRTPYGFGSSLHLMAHEWGTSAPWLGVPEPILPEGGAVAPGDLFDLLVPVAATLLGAGLAWAGRAWAALRLQALVALTAFITFVSVARITDVVYDYLVRWTWIVGLLIWLAALYAIWSGAVALITRAAAHRQARTPLGATPARVPWHTPVGRAAVVAVVLLGGIVLADRARATVADVPTVLPELGSQEPLSKLIPQLLANVPTEGTLWIRSEGGFNNAHGDGLTLALERAGHTVALHPVERYKFGPSRTTDATEKPAATLSYVYADNVAEWEQRAGVEEMARWDPLTPDERTEFIALDQELKEQFRAVGRDDLVEQVEKNDSAGLGLGMAGIDQDALTRWEKFRVRGQLIAVYLSDPPPWPPTP